MKKTFLSILLALTIVCSTLAYSVSAGIYVKDEDGIVRVYYVNMQYPRVVLEDEKIQNREYSESVLRDYLNFSMEVTRVPGQFAMMLDCDRVEETAREVAQIVGETLQYECLYSNGIYHMLFNTDESVLYDTLLKLLLNGYVVTISPTYLPSSGAVYSYGDLDRNGKVDSKDYMMIKRIVLGTYTSDEKQNKLADINGDGKIGAQDYMIAKRHVLGTYEIIYGCMLA